MCTARGALAGALRWRIVVGQGHAGGGRGRVEGGFRVARGRSSARRGRGVLHGRGGCVLRGRECAGGEVDVQCEAAKQRVGLA